MPRESTRTNDDVDEGDPVSPDRSVAEIAHDMVNSAMAIDLRLGVMESRDPSAAISALRESTNELLILIRELEGPPYV